MLRTTFRFQVIRDELKKGKTEKQVEQKLTDDYGEGILYAPKFDLQSSLLYLMPVREAVGGCGAGWLGGWWGWFKLGEGMVVNSCELQ